MPQLLLIQSSSTQGCPGVPPSLPPNAGFSCQTVDWNAMRRENLSTSAAQLIVAVAYPQTAEAVSLFEWLRSNPVAVPTLAVVSTEIDHGDLRTILAAADEFVVSPVHPQEFHLRIMRMLNTEAMTETPCSRLIDKFGMFQLVGRDPVFVSNVEKIPSIARVDAAVLITGETGTGKEMFARAIHHLSRRRSLPFIPVDCGSVPEHLFENEMFGHRRGAFTDAREEQRGLVAMANGGTLFLDEIDALSLTAQAKILRFLQEHTYKPLGADRFLCSDIRIVAATNRDIESCVRQKQFRADLYYRLNVLRCELPPLRQRVGDISVLSRHFVKTLCSDQVESKVLSPTALYKLNAYDWPGNVRELLNVLQRAIVFADSSEIHASQISLPQSVDVSIATEATSFRQAKARTIEAFERMFVESALQRHHGNITQAAYEAGKERRAFGRLVKKYNINRFAS